MGLKSLFTPKWQHKLPEVRQQAIMDVTDSGILANVVLHDRDKAVRATALARLNDQAQLSEIAQKSDDESIRQLATKRVTEQKLLAEIAIGSSDYAVRQSAVERVVEQDCLARVAISNADFHVRANAISRVTDQKLLAQIIKSDPDWLVYKATIERLKDQNLLANIARSNPKANARRAALVRLEDDALLADIARSNPNGDVRRCAVERLEDKDTLAAIARNDPDTMVRRCAIARLGTDFKVVEGGKTVAGALPQVTSIKSMYDGSPDEGSQILAGDGDLTAEQIAHRVLRAVAENATPRHVNEDYAERLAESNEAHLNEYCSRYPGIESLSDQLGIKPCHLAFLFFYTEECFNAYDSQLGEKAEWSEWVLRAIQYYVQNILFIIEANGGEYYLYRDTTANAPHLVVEDA